VDAQTITTPLLAPPATVQEMVIDQELAITQLAIAQDSVTVPEMATDLELATVLEIVATQELAADDLAALAGTTAVLQAVDQLATGGSAVSSVEDVTSLVVGHTDGEQAIIFMVVVDHQLGSTHFLHHQLSYRRRRSSSLAMLFKVPHPLRMQLHSAAMTAGVTLMMEACSVVITTGRSSAAVLVSARTHLQLMVTSLKHPETLKTRHLMPDPTPTKAHHHLDNIPTKAHHRLDNTPTKARPHKTRRSMALLHKTRDHHQQVMIKDQHHKAPAQAVEAMVASAAHMVA